MPRVRRPLLALIALVVALAVGYGIKAARSGDPAPRHSTTSTVQASTVAPLSSLPEQARQTVTLIEQGGPFPYPRNDGAVFHNNERLLPGESDGYYREYTVSTPGSSDRGPRRIITGQGGEFYYTANHYSSFVRIDVNR
ncbi:MAG: ribonuclease domain-containing protein [Actinomycetota bacterium]